MPAIAEVSIKRAAAALLLAGGLLLSGTRGAEEEETSPEFQPIRAMVLQHFSRMPLYREGDLISQGQVQPLLGNLARLGLDLPDPKAFIERVPAEGSFLVRQLRTRQGREFMLHLAGSPAAYERLERLAAMKRGKKTVAELIHRGEKGAGVIVYFAEEPDGKKMGRLMARRGQSPNFNESTGKIYTVEQLLGELEKLYRKAQQPAPQPR
jgi:hypothetical protein